MSVTNPPAQNSLAKKHYLKPSSGDFSAFKEIVKRETSLDDYPLASATEQGALVYTADTVKSASANATSKQALMAEWIKVWLDGPGVLMISGAMAADLIEEVNQLFDKIIRRQRESGGGGGDHFAKAGANDRIWNALQKHGLSDPASFANYYANESIALASEAWLGPGYWVSAQVNRVNPGGAAQSAHRDYHLGFMSEAQIKDYPMHVHQLSPVLTLQGAVAHCDMPLETGPTLYLPYSQHYAEGYLAFGRSEFQDYFSEHHSQLALKTGDMVFFNPALMHAAGENKTTDRYRLANLLQVSSPFGRSIESIDFLSLIKAVYPELLEMKQQVSLTAEQLHNAICACTDGYPFPTCLDTDLPSDGLAPKSQRLYVQEALDSDASMADLMRDLHDQMSRKSSVWPK